MTNIRSQKGTALVMVMIMIVVLSGLAAFMLQGALQKAQSADQLIENSKSLNVAEAGIDRVMQAINNDLTLAQLQTLGIAYPTTAARTDTPCGSGSYFVTISDWSADGVDNDGINGVDDTGELFWYTVTSIAIGDIGTRWPVEKTVEVIVKRQTGTGFARAMFGDIGVDLRGAVLTDSYDSDVGPYGSRPRGSKGDVASNRLVQLGGTVDVWGSATSGPGYATDQGTAFVAGSTASSTATITLPPVTYSPPAGCLPAVASGTIASSVTNGVTLGTGNYRCSSIALANKQVLSVSGDAVLYVDGDIHMTALSRITITSGSLTIYQDSGSLDLTGGNEVNGYYDKTSKTSVMGKPAQMLILSNTDQSIKLVGNAEASMCLYAPRAEIDLRGNYDFFGSVVGHSIVNTGTPDFHYDEALGRMQFFATGPCELKAWREVR